MREKETDRKIEIEIEIERRTRERLSQNNKLSYPNLQFN